MSDAIESAEIAALGERMRAQASDLRALGSQRIDSALIAAVARLRSDAALIEALQASTSLSAAMLAWGLDTTLRSVTPNALQALRAQADAGAPAELAAVVLAGNLFTACVRGLLIPLSLGVPVLAKASSRDPVLPRALAAALHAADPEVGRHLHVVTFEHGDIARARALLGAAEAVSVYGSDAGVAAIGALLDPQRQRLVAHGHGLSLALVTRESLHDASSADDVLRALALDIAAYDQLGCLSPHAIFVERGGALSAEQLAERLCLEHLQRIQEQLPRGQLDAHARAASLQWRAAAAVRGRLWTGSAHAVSYEADEPLRPSPGHRHVSVHDCSDASVLERIQRLAQTLGAHLKLIGCAGPDALRGQLAQSLAPLRLCNVGEMQTPSFDSNADARPATWGLIRRR